MTWVSLDREMKPTINKFENISFSPMLSLTFLYILMNVKRKDGTEKMFIEIEQNVRFKPFPSFIIW